MKRLARLCVALPFAALLFGACVESKESIQLRPDGSGRIDRAFALASEARAALRAALADLYRIPAEHASALHLDPLDPRWLERRAAGEHGYHLEFAERTLADGRERTVLAARFDGPVAGLRGGLAAAVAGGAFPGAGMRLERRRGREDGDPEVWRLEIREGWGWIGDEDRGALGGVDLSVVRERLAPLLAGGRFERAIVFPAKVHATNGTLGPDGVTVRWSRDATAFLEEGRLLAWAEFLHRDDLSLSSFRIEPDPRALVRQLLRAPPELEVLLQAGEAEEEARPEEADGESDPPGAGRKPAADAEADAEAEAGTDAPPGR